MLDELLRDGLLRQFDPRIGILLGALELLGGGLTVRDRVEPLHLDRDLAIGDRLHLERVQTAEIGDLFKGQRGVLDQPYGGRFRHQRSWHGKFPV